MYIKLVSINIILLVVVFFLTLTAVATTTESANAQTTTIKNDSLAGCIDFLEKKNTEFFQLNQEINKNNNNTQTENNQENGINIDLSKDEFTRNMLFIETCNFTKEATGKYLNLLPESEFEKYVKFGAQSYLLKLFGTLGAGLSSSPHLEDSNNDNTNTNNTINNTN